MAEKPEAETDTNWIRALVKSRASALGLSARSIALRLEGEVSIRQMERYLAGQVDLTSRPLGHVFRLLGLEIVRAELSPSSPLQKLP